MQPDRPHPALRATFSRAAGEGKAPRAIATFAFLLFTLALVIPWSWERYLASLPPLNLDVTQGASTIVIDRNAKLLRAFTTEDGRWRLPLTRADVDPKFFQLLMAYEDGRFATHHGVDYRALARAAGQMATSGHVVSGGSTLTMQVARLLEPREDRSLSAKFRQAVRAWQLERQLSKTQILNLYLALAPYGGNLEGLRAASIAYFGKEPKRLSIAEAALLVALPQSPETRRPDRFAPTARAARARVLARALARGVITPAEAEQALADPVPGARRPFPALAPLAAEAALRADPARRVHRLSLDAHLQAQLETLAKDGAERAGPKLSAAILAIDNLTGEIRAHVGSSDYFSTARGGAVDMTEAVRSPGSALKPFIYALAFERGIAHPETQLDDRPARYGVYAPENFDLSFQGTVSARRALQYSLNVPAIELLSNVGPSHFLARLHEAGATIDLPKDAPPGLAIGLGGLGIKLADMARLYAGLARGGSVPDLVERLDAPLKPAAEQMIAEPVAAWYVADILRGAPPPANAAAGRIAFKTGTSYGYRDAWAIGFDRRTTIAVWLGRPDNGASPGLIGRVSAAPILFDAFARLGREIEIVKQPPNALVVRGPEGLPPPLRSLRAGQARTLEANALPPLKIAYPPDGARIDLGLTQRGSGEATPLALKAQGGAPPLTWLVNGKPVGEAQIRRQSSWTPDGAGFARVSVMDASGMTDSVSVRLE